MALMWSTIGLTSVSPPPKSILHMIQERPLTFGDTVTPFAAREAPSNLSWSGINKGSYYTLLMVDVDVPARSTPNSEKFQGLHWLVVNIPGDNILLPHRGLELAPYIGPGPSSGSGKHRYVFLIFEEGKTPIDFKKARIFSQDRILERLLWNFERNDTKWSVEQFVKWASFPTAPSASSSSTPSPVAATVFEASHDSWVETLRSTFVDAAATD